MKRPLIFLFTIIAIALLIFAFIQWRVEVRTSLDASPTPESATISATPSQTAATASPDLNSASDANLSDEVAELVGFKFMQDFVKAGPPEPDQTALDDAYNALSSSAKNNVSRATLSRDLALMVGVQDVPDQGVSVEDLRVESDQAWLTVGMNYSGSGQTLRVVELVQEDGFWKVADVTHD